MTLIIALSRVVLLYLWLADRLEGTATLVHVKVPRLSSTKPSEHSEQILVQLSPATQELREPFTAHAADIIGMWRQRARFNIREDRDSIRNTAQLLSHERQRGTWAGTE